MGVFVKSGGGLAEQLAKRAGQQIASGGAVANQATAVQQEVDKLSDKKDKITDAVNRQAAMMAQQYALAGAGYRRQRAVRQRPGQADVGVRLSSLEQQRRHRRRLDRARKQIALGFVAAQLAQHRQLHLRFHAFGDDAHLQAMAERHDGAHDRRAVGIAPRSCTKARSIFRRCTGKRFR